MGTLKTILGSMGLMLASSVAQGAEPLIAGPIPAETKDGFATVTCSVTNLSPTPQAISFTLHDSSNTVFEIIECGLSGAIPHFGSCQVTVQAFRIAAGVSPFFCVYQGAGTPPGPVSGSICVTLSDATGCLPALPFPPDP
jgi:hypothetical protein